MLEASKSFKAISALVVDGETISCDEMMASTSLPAIPLSERPAQSDVSGSPCESNCAVASDLLSVLAVITAFDLSVNTLVASNCFGCLYLQSIFFWRHLEHGDERASQCVFALMHARHDRFLDLGGCLAFFRQ